MKRLRTATVSAFVVCIALFAHASVFAQSPEAKGKYTKKVKTPVNAHMMSTLDEGIIRGIRGTLTTSDGDTPRGSIISVYRIIDDRSEFVYSFLVGADGIFDFKDLKDGKYLLKTGTTDGNFNQLNITVVLARKDKQASDENLEIRLEVGT